MLFALFAALALFGAGCGGINATGTVSPATFFLPGLLKNDTPIAVLTNAPAALPDPAKELASAN